MNPGDGEPESRHSAPARLDRHVSDSTETRTPIAIRASFGQTSFQRFFITPVIFSCSEMAPKRGSAHIFPHVPLSDFLSICEPDVRMTFRVADDLVISPDSERSTIGCRMRHRSEKLSAFLIEDVERPTEDFDIAAEGSAVAIMHSRWCPRAGVVYLTSLRPLPASTKKGASLFA